MNITFTKTETGCRTACRRDDGSDIAWDGVMSGSIPHDLVHWIVEDHFRLKASFYGHVASGHDPYSVNELADRDSELSQTELLVLCLQGELAALEGITHAPPETVRGRYGMRYPEYCSEADVSKLVEIASQSMGAWKAMNCGESLKRHF